MQFKIDGEPMELDSVEFTIGGRKYDVPIFNLETIRLALRVYPEAARATDDAERSDRMIEAYLQILERRMASVDDSPLTVAFINRHLLGKDECDGLTVSMLELMRRSGFIKKGEGTEALETAQPELPLT